MFQLTKVLEQAADPRTLFFCFLIAGTVLLWTRWHRTGCWFVTASVGIAFLFAVMPISSTLLAILETRFPPPEPLPARVDGIVVLGGDFDPAMIEVHGPLAVASPRLAAFADLARHYSRARLVFAGGSGRVLRPELREADQAVRILPHLGVNVERVVFERDSRNTHENAVFARRLADPKAGEVWLLVTSAAHMPRAIGTFRRAGWPVQPYPVDFLTGPRAVDSLRLQFDSGTRFLAVVAREVAGLAVYYALGRTDALFPAP